MKPYDVMRAFVIAHAGALRAALHEYAVIRNAKAQVIQFDKSVRNY